ncbi:threonylcarbamoyl-AMP synthase [Patescibacteria group bacterium]|jgi:L-threonylcarbamoyladenylate synthase|nr:threonylcarbamoyl-AMP synthase [Patescibacteria group bacterium]
MSETTTSPATPEAIAQAAELIRAGELVAFPTETVYGLGGNAREAHAVAKIFTAKERPQDNPLIVHFTERAQAEELAREIPPKARALMDAFWPGPLSIVLKKSALVPNEATAGLDTVVLRCPSHPVARALIDAAGVPIAAPSANRSGRPSPTRAEHVHADLAGRIPLILDAGPVEHGLESTVLDLTTQPPTLLRPGSVTREALEAVIGPITHRTEASDAAHPRAPGMKYRHYAPEAHLTLVCGAQDARREALRERAAAAAGRGEVVGRIILGSTEDTDPFCRVLGPTPREYAAGLFGALRELDEAGVTCIFAEGVDEAHLGAAVMDRLRKAADEVVSVS